MFIERRRLGAIMRRFASFTSILVLIKGRRSAATEIVFGQRGNRPHHIRVRTGCRYLGSPSVCPSVCVAFVLSTDCESCTRPISTNPVSMVAGEYGLTRRTCLVADCLEVVAVAGLLGTSWCPFGAAGFFRVVFSRFFLFSSNAHGLLQI